MNLLRIDKKYVPILATLVVLGLVYAFGVLRYGDRGFDSLYNFVAIFRGGAVVGIAAIGATFIILSGGIDLSVGSVIAFTTIFIATLVSPEHGPGWHPMVVIPLALLVGLGFGALQGCLIHFYDLPPFLVTLGGMFLARGMAFVVHSETLGIDISEGFFATVGGISLPLTDRVKLPLVVMLLIGCYIVAMFVAHFLKLGREVYAVGGDEASAKLMGINVGRVKVGVYALGGLTSALAGVAWTLDMNSGDPAGFVGYELDAIAAVVIGGTLLTGGVGLVIGTLAGTLILGLIRNIIDNEGTLSTWWTNISTGVLLLLFILMQTALVGLSNRRRAAGGGAAASEA